jgi:hypothetical protein
MKAGLTISIKELLNLAGELYKEQQELNLSLGIKEIDMTRKYLVNIKNDEGLSDTWTLD